MTTSGLLNLKSGDALLSDLGDATAGTGTLQVATVTVNTSLLPDASGGADIGSASAEFGDVYLADDKAVKFGSDQDASIQWDADGTATLQVTGATTFDNDATFKTAILPDASGGADIG